MNATGLDVQVMTASASRELVFEKAQVDAQLKGRGGIFDALVQRWENYLLSMTWEPPVPPDKQWVMWDIAILEAFRFPEMAQKMTVPAPLGPPGRTVTVYTDIDAAAMKADLWKHLRAYREAR